MHFLFVFVVSFAAVNGRLFRLPRSRKMATTRETISVLAKGLQDCGPFGQRMPSVVSHCGSMFRNVRQRYGLTDIDYVKLIDPAAANDITNADSKSGQMLCRFRHGELVLKCVTQTEFDTVRRLLPSYEEHINGSASALAGLLGLHEVQLPSGERRHVLAMRDVLPQETTTRVIDVKGSMVGREAVNKTAVMKELDMISSQQPLSLGDHTKQKLLEIIRRDCNFLQRHGLIDYSLLVVEVPKSPPSTVDESATQFVPVEPGLCAILARFWKMWLRPTEAPVGMQARPREIYSEQRSATDAICCVRDDRGRLCVVGESSIYYLALIDFLQQYTFRKRLENFFKGLLGYDRTLISCVDPARYSKRLQSFLKYWTK